MRIFTSRWFQRFARKEGISDDALCDAVARAEKGQIDADLGGEVGSLNPAKVDREATGLSSASAVARAFFVYGFSKNHRANIDAGEEQQFKEAAKYVLALKEQHLNELLRKGDFLEVK